MDQHREAVAVAREDQAADFGQRIGEYLRGLAVGEMIAARKVAVANMQYMPPSWHQGMYAATPRAQLRYLPLGEALVCISLAEEVRS